MNGRIWESAIVFLAVLLTPGFEGSVVNGQRRVAVEKIDYKGWSNCYRITNGIVDVIVTTDVGPRVIRFGFVGEENEFKEFTDQVGKSGGSEWFPYGGHRLWHAPEHPVRTYFPDNGPVKSVMIEGGIKLIQPVETTTGIQKELSVTLSPVRAHVAVSHLLRNTNQRPVELAAWALTILAPGGTAVFPLPARGSHPRDLLPTSTISLWAYTDMADPRWTWGAKFILLRQDSNAKQPQKAGFMTPDGWGAYARDGKLFVKKAQYVVGAHYTDLGANFETFTNAGMLELETLGPLTTIEPGASVEHVEHWFLFKEIAVPQNDADVEKGLMSKIQEAGK